MKEKLETFLFSPYKVGIWDIIVKKENGKKNERISLSDFET